MAVTKLVVDPMLSFVTKVCFFLFNCIESLVRKLCQSWYRRHFQLWPPPILTRKELCVFYCGCFLFNVIPSKLSEIIFFKSGIIKLSHIKWCVVMLQNSTCWNLLRHENLSGVVDSEWFAIMFFRLQQWKLHCHRVPRTRS